MDTMVVENEFGAVLKYPESFRVSLVQRPHDSTCIRRVLDKVRLQQGVSKIMTSSVQLDTL